MLMLPTFEPGYPTLVWGSLLFNTIVFFLTLYKTVSAFRAAKSAGIKSSFYFYLLRDGMEIVCSLYVAYIRFFKRREHVLLVSNRSVLMIIPSILLKCAGRAVVCLDIIFLVAAFVSYSDLCLVLRFAYCANRATSITHLPSSTVLKLLRL